MGRETNRRADALSRPEGVDKVLPKVRTLLPEWYFVRCLSRWEEDQEDDEQENTEEKRKTIGMYHDLPTAGHPGISELWTCYSRMDIIGRALEGMSNSM
jgi:hypothetical protein